MSKSWSNDEIKAIVNTIQKSRDLDKEALSHKYSEFKIKFPSLFEAAMKPDFPLQYLDMMLQERTNILTEKQTVDETDKLVYDKLRERYINPLLEKMV